MRAERDHREDRQAYDGEQDNGADRADDLAPGGRNQEGAPGLRKEDSLVARPGSSAASRRSISASIRCSSIDSAIAPYLRVPRAGGNCSNYPLHKGVYPIVLRLCPTLFAPQGTHDS